MPRRVRSLGNIALLAIGACGGSDATTPPAKVVARVVVAGTAALNVGQNSTLTATAFEASGAQLVSPGAVAWSSSAPLIATVDQAGKITGVSAGVATASADIAGVRGSLAVRVNPSPVVSKDTIFTLGTNTFSPSPLTVAVGSTVIFALGFDGIGHDVRFAVKPGSPSDIPVTTRQYVARTLSVAGDFSYFCPTHPQMTGVITVQ